MWHDMSLSFSFICVSCSLLGRAKVYRVLFVFHKTLSSKESPFRESSGFVLQCCIWRLEMSLLFIENVIGRVCMFMYIHTSVLFEAQRNKYEVFLKKSQTCCAPVQPWIATLMNVALHFFLFTWVSFVHDKGYYVMTCFDQFLK